MSGKQPVDVDHYEALFDATYLRWFHLRGQPALVRITRVRKNVELTLRGGALKKAPVIDLELVRGHIEEIKPLVLNVTNTEAIAEIHGNKPSQWAGCEIVLYQSETKLRGKPVNCIRIRERKRA